MWVTVRRTNGDIEEIDLPPNQFLEIGDILSDGSVVLDLEWPDELDDDMEALELY